MFPSTPSALLLNRCVLCGLSVVLFQCSSLPQVPELPRRGPEVAADHGYYLNFSLDGGLRVTARLHVDSPGNFQIVLGANRPLPAKFAKAITVTLNGSAHRSIDYATSPRAGRVFLVLTFSVREGDLYSGGYLDCHLSVAQKHLQSMTAEERALFRGASLEFGFGRVE